MEESANSTSHLRTYALVFFALAVITILEIILSRPGITAGKGFLTPTFLVFSLAKASLVAAFFMHLKNDSKLYSAIFILPAALLLIFALLATVS
jgi:caa(3)-type oxidase subunit IV